MVLLTRTEVADLFSVSVKTLDRIRRDDPKFPAPVTIASSVRWRQTDVERYVQGLAPEPAPTRSRAKSARELMA